MHEVRPVACPSGRFEDHRFAVNCWLCRETGG
jgi:Rps23 Pro-64 3,4-dihydroxylase Tpa1-like proline 4-hydroxylase